MTCSRLLTWELQIATCVYEAIHVHSRAWCERACSSIDKSSVRHPCADAHAVNYCPYVYPFCAHHAHAFPQQIIVRHCEQSFPTTQSMLTYALLAAIFLPLLLCSGADVKSVFREKGRVYALLAFADVEGNALMVKAYQYTTLTSVQVCIL